MEIPVLENFTGVVHLLQATSQNRHVIIPWRQWSRLPGPLVPHTLDAHQVKATYSHQVHTEWPVFWLSLLSPALHFYFTSILHDLALFCEVYIFNYIIIY